jgi:murein DD-endopeptidase MepM/ murein hydrolase activator NlpD
MSLLSCFPVQTGHGRISFHDSFLNMRPRSGQPHSGIDIGGELGAPIVAATNGHIVRRCVIGGIPEPGAGNRRYSGNYVVVVDSQRYFYYYFHLQSLNAGARPGTAIRPGQVLGTMGNTGLGGPVHLHFQVWRPFSQPAASDWYASLSFPVRFRGAVSIYQELETLALRLPGARRTRGPVPQPVGPPRQDVPGVIIG